MLYQIAYLFNKCQGRRIKGDLYLRLAKYLAHAGIASRRQAEEIILQGRVKVNGIVVTEVATGVDPRYDRIEYDGFRATVEKFVYVLLNKPSGYICTVSDTHGRPTVLDLVGAIKERVYPVGRLDYDTEGLLLLSNDGQFTNCMIHPRFKINKTYRAWVAGRIEAHDLNRLRQGVELEDGITAPAIVEIIKQDINSAVIELIIHEGRKRQIKRMFSSIKHPVIRLQRIAFAFLTLEGVEVGNYRLLSQDEVDGLLGLAGIH